MVWEKFQFCIFLFRFEVSCRNPNMVTKRMNSILFKQFMVRLDAFVDSVSTFFFLPNIDISIDIISTFAHLQ